MAMLEPEVLFMRRIEELYDKVVTLRAITQSQPENADLCDSLISLENTITQKYGTA